MIVDCHAHVFPPLIKNNRSKYASEDPCFAMLYSKGSAKMSTADELIASMDKNGIDKSIIVNIGWTTHDLCLETNDYILESIARFPERLIGFCAVQPLAMEAALLEMERCADAGARGIGELRPDVQYFNLLDEEMTGPFVKMMRHHKLVLMTHTSEPVGHSYPGKGSVTPDLLYPFISNYPDLPVICSHWGGGLPFYALMPEVKKAFKNVYFDTAATSLLYDKQVFQAVTELVGADKILYGSDFPLIEQGKSVKDITSLGLKGEAGILGGNAASLLGIKG